MIRKEQIIEKMGQMILDFDHENNSITGCNKFALSLYNEITPVIAQQAREEIISILEKPLMYFKTGKLNSTYTQCPTNTTSHFCDQELVDALRQALKESK